MKDTTPARLQGGSFTQEASLPPPEVELAVVPPSGYTVQLIEATPLPFIGQTIRPGDYRLTIRVHKLV